MPKVAGQILEKIGLKQPVLKLYLWAHRNALAARFSIRKFILPKLINQRKKSGFLAVDICNNFGLGSKLEWSLEIMAYCEEYKLIPRFRFSYPGSDDFFHQFFFVNGANEEQEKLEFTKIESMTELGFGKDYDQTFTIEYANSLIKKYLGIQQYILDEVNDFCARNFLNKKVLGVHYRSTDKVGEAPAVAYETVKKNIEYYIEKFPETGAVFLSTDDDHFRRYLEMNFNKRILIVREDHFRSKDNSSVHHNKNIDKYEMNKDALVNCLLLSKCSALLKSSSFLSDWSKLFNPSIPVIMLNQPYDHALWFPAREIKKQVLYQPV